MSRTMSITEVAGALSKAIPDDTLLPDLMVGLAAFTAAVIYRGYVPEMHPQIVITHANTILEMISRVETEEVQDAILEDVEEEEETEKKKWMQ